MRLRILLVLAASLLSASADAAVRALFVGISRYERGSDEPGAEFPNLWGPVNDVGLIKKALRDAVALQVDPLLLDTKDTACRGSNDVSITLVDKCATRTELLNALHRQIDGSEPGDVVLFYFAGHGAPYEDDRHENASGKKQMILPYDARKPGETTEILDRELRAIIAAAVARGVSMVTIFDSCFSGSATRELSTAHSRSIGGIQKVHLSEGQRKLVDAPLVEEPTSGPGGAYAVHLAAASETELANEFEFDKQWDGAFTHALVPVIGRMPGATYEEIARETRRLLYDRIQGTQHPQGEGALGTPFLNSQAGRTRIYAGAPVDAKSVAISGGTLSGITEGSTFAVSAQRQERDLPPMLAQGTIVRAGVADAVLVLDRPPAQPLPAAVQLRETAHRYGLGRLRVAVRFDDPAAAAAATAALKPIELIEPSTQAPNLILAGHAGQAALCSIDGHLLEQIGRVDDPLFTERVTAAARVIARFQEMLALRNDAGPSRATFELARNCPAGSDDCAALPIDPEPVFTPGEKIRITIVNKTGRKQYLYLFDLENDRFSVTPLIPPGARDFLDKDHDFRNFHVTAGEPGHAQLLLLSTDDYIDLSTLQQDGLPRELQDNPLARLLQAAGKGARATDVPKVGDWGGTLLSLRVEDPQHPVQEPSSPCATFSR